MGLAPHSALACETLARVRKLSRNTPALQFNIATKGGQQLKFAARALQVFTDRHKMTRKAKKVMITPYREIDLSMDCLWSYSCTRRCAVKVKIPVSSWMTRACLTEGSRSELSVGTISAKSNSTIEDEGHYISLELHDAQKYEARQPSWVRLISMAHRLHGMSATSISTNGLDMDRHTLAHKIQEGCERASQRTVPVE